MGSDLSNDKGEDFIVPSLGPKCCSICFHYFCFDRIVNPYHHKKRCKNRECTCPSQCGLRFTTGSNSESGSHFCCNCSKFSSQKSSSEIRFVPLFDSLSGFRAGYYGDPPRFVASIQNTEISDHDIIEKIIKSSPTINEHHNNTIKELLKRRPELLGTKNGKARAKPGENIFYVVSENKHATIDVYETIFSFYKDKKEILEVWNNIPKQVSKNYLFNEPPTRKMNIFEKTFSFHLTHDHNKNRLGHGFDILNFMFDYFNPQATGSTSTKKKEEEEEEGEEEEDEVQILFQRLLNSSSEIIRFLLTRSNEYFIYPKNVKARKIRRIKNLDEDTDEEEEDQFVIVNPQKKQKKKRTRSPFDILVNFIESYPHLKTHLFSTRSKNDKNLPKINIFHIIFDYQVFLHRKSFSGSSKRYNHGEILYNHFFPSNNNDDKMSSNIKNLIFEKENNVSPFDVLLKAFFTEQDDDREQQSKFYRSFVWKMVFVEKVKIEFFKFIKIFKTFIKHFKKEEQQQQQHQMIETLKSMYNGVKEKEMTKIELLGASKMLETLFHLRQFLAIGKDDNNTYYIEDRKKSMLFDRWKYNVKLRSRKMKILNMMEVCNGSEYGICIVNRFLETRQEYTFNVLYETERKNTKNELKNEDNNNNNDDDDNDDDYLFTIGVANEEYIPAFPVLKMSEEYMKKRKSAYGKNVPAEVQEKKNHFEEDVSGSGINMDAIKLNFKIEVKEFKVFLDGVEFFEFSDYIASRPCFFLAFSVKKGDSLTVL